jgi:hypothetical protein
MKLYRTWIPASALLLLAGCSAPTLPNMDDGEVIHTPDALRGSAAPTQPMPTGGGFGSGTAASGNMFGSGTIMSAPSLDGAVTDSTASSSSRAGNLFGSGT